MNIEQVNISKIHKSYAQERLSYLVGAGASIDAGLPTWTALNRRLLQQFFVREYRDQQAELLVAPEPDELEALASIFVDRFGREPVVDLIRDRVGDPEEFRALLRQALYGASGPVELQSLQYELVAALGAASGKPKTKIFTTNFDNLLERAYCRLHELDESGLLAAMAVIASDEERAAAAPNRPEFVHLHGYLPVEGRAHGRLVLSEKDFFETRDGWPTRELKAVVDNPERDLLVVGMSLADPRLRAVLHQRATKKAPTGNIFVLLSESSVDEDATLAQRRAHKLLGKYELRYWHQLGVHLRLVSNLEMLPLLLRKVRLGENSTDWCKMARDYLMERTRDNAGESIFDRLYTELKQREARALIAGQLQFVRRLFEVDDQEELTLGFFVPSPSDAQHIQLAFRYNDRFSDEEYVIDSANSESFQGVPAGRGADRQLEISTVETAQGAAGYAYATGTVVQAVESSSELNREFSPEMLRDWDTGRTFSSLLCVPISGGPNWLPLGVGFLSSNRKAPFWAGFSPEQTVVLQRLMRKIFKMLVGFSGHHG